MCVLIFACDLPVKNEVQNFIGSNGKYGCSYCYQKGSSIANLSHRNTIRFVNKENVNLRIHKEILALIQSATSLVDGEKIKSVEGVKGKSALLMFPLGYDVINSFSIDYMHGIGLGIGKDLMKIWLAKRNIPNPPYPGYKIKDIKKREILRDRILKLKPTMNFHRKPRSILDISDNKASEVMNCLWYYLRYSLVGLVETKIIKHFEQLSAASYMLCKTDISREEMKKACRLLTTFAIEFEEIYGPGSITMNIHLLKHYFNMVENCGPLWAHSLFGFENISKLKKMVNGNTDYLEQIY